MALNALHFDYVAALARDMAAIVLERGKEYLVELRLSPLARAQGFASLEHFIEHLRTRPVERAHHQVVDALTTNETMFFRDGAPFEFLRTSLLPALAARPGQARQVRVWSAACSTGQEPYTLAMVMREHPALRDWEMQIQATDLSLNALALAAAGRYSGFEIGRGLPVELRDKYFTRQGPEWVVRDELRRMIQFRQLNLAQPWLPQAGFDFIFLRNVMIYFDVPTKQQILRRMRDCLRPGGVLFLGTAETTVTLDPQWTPEQHAGAVAYRAVGGAG